MDRPLQSRFRAAFYVDGFNMYHAIDGLGKPYLKWLGLRRLAEIVCTGKNSEVGRVAFFTAYFPGNDLKTDRHKIYVRALENTGVDVTLGKTMSYDAKCKMCDRTRKAHTEKETDINMALAAYADAVADAYDHAYLITADTDQAATIKAIKRDFSNKKIFIVTPPGRSHASYLESLCDGRIRLTEDHIDRAVMCAVVSSPSGGLSAVMPEQYGPPDWWVHPDNRPRPTR